MKLKQSLWCSHLLDPFWVYTPQMLNCQRPPYSVGVIVAHGVSFQVLVPLFKFKVLKDGIHGVFFSPFQVACVHDRGFV